MKGKVISRGGRKERTAMIAEKYQASLRTGIKISRKAAKTLSFLAYSKAVRNAVYPIRRVGRIKPMIRFSFASFALAGNLWSRGDLFPARAPMEQGGGSGP